MIVELVRLAVIGQLLVERALFIREWMVEVLVHDQQVGPAFQQPTGRTKVARSCGLIAQRAGIFIDAEHQQRGIDRRHGECGGGQPLDQQGRGGSHLVAAEGPPWGQLPCQGMMVDDLDRCLRTHPPNRLDRLRVNQDHLLDSPPGQVFQGHKRQHLRILGQKGFQVAIHLARQHRRRVGIEPRSCQHAGQGIEVSMLVRQDDGHGLRRVGHLQARIRYSLPYTNARHGPGVSGSTQQKRLNAGVGRTCCKG